MTLLNLLNGSVCLGLFFLSCLILNIWDFADFVKKKKKKTKGKKTPDLNIEYENGSCCKVFHLLNDRTTFYCVVVLMKAEQLNDVCPAEHLFEP